MESFISSPYRSSRRTVDRLCITVSGCHFVAVWGRQIPTSDWPMIAPLALPVEDFPLQAIVGFYIARGEWTTCYWAYLSIFFDPLLQSFSLKWLASGDDANSVRHHFLRQWANESLDLDHTFFWRMVVHEEEERTVWYSVKRKGQEERRGRDKAVCFWMQVRQIDKLWGFPDKLWGMKTKLGCRRHFPISK